MKGLFKKMIKSLTNNVFMNFQVSVILSFNRKNKVYLIEFEFFF